MSKKTTFISSIIFITITLCIILIFSNISFNKDTSINLTSTSSDDSISPERIRYIDNGDGTATVFSIDLGTADVNGMTQANASFGSTNQNQGDILQSVSFGYDRTIIEDSPDVNASGKYYIYIPTWTSELNTYFSNYQYKQKSIRNVNNLSQSIKSLNENIYNDGTINYQNNEVIIPSEINGLKVTKISSVKDLIDNNYSGNYYTYQRYYSSDVKQISVNSTNNQAQQADKPYKNAYETQTVQALTSTVPTNQYSHYYVNGVDDSDLFSEIVFLLSGENGWGKGFYTSTRVKNSLAQGNVGISTTYLNIPQVATGWQERSFNTDFTTSSANSNIFSYSNDLRAANPFNYNNVAKQIPTDVNNTSTGQFTLYNLTFKYEGYNPSGLVYYTTRSYCNYLLTSYYYFLQGSQDVTETPKYSNYKETYHEITTSSNTITSIVIPDTVTEISSNAFVGCNNVTKISGAGNLTTVSTEAFKNLSSLEYVILPNITTISGEAFVGCTNLKEISINQIILELGADPFRDQKNVKVICSSQNVYNGSKDVFTSRNVINNLTYYVNVNYIDPQTGATPTFFTTNFSSQIAGISKVYASDQIPLPTKNDLTPFDTTWYKDAKILTEYSNNIYTGRLINGTSTNLYIKDNKLNPGYVPDYLTIYVSYELKDNNDLLNNYKVEYLNSSNKNVINDKFTFKDLKQNYTLSMNLNSNLTLPDRYDVSYKYYVNNKEVDLDNLTYNVSHANDFDIRYEIIFKDKYTNEITVVSKNVFNYEKATIKVYTKDQYLYDLSDLKSVYGSDYYLTLNGQKLNYYEYLNYFNIDTKIDVDSNNEIILTNLGRSIEDFNIEYPYTSSYIKIKKPSVLNDKKLFIPLLVLLFSILLCGQFIILYGVKKNKKEKNK